MQIGGGNFKSQRNLNREKDKRTSMIILVCIIIVIMLIAGLMYAIMYIQQNTFRVYIDGKTVNLPSDMILIDEATRKNSCRHYGNCKLFRI